MTAIRSRVVSGDPAAGDLIPHIVPDVEGLVFDVVKEAVAPGGPITFFPDSRADQPEVPVFKGWPVYPGKVPAIGIVLGTQSEDQGGDSISGGFAGEVERRNDAGDLTATGEYHVHPLYSTVIVELIHENRDERDRHHNSLTLVLFALRRRLVGGLIRRVRVDAEKQELPLDEQPIVIYASIFTVHVYYDQLEAVDVHGEGGIDLIEAIPTTANSIQAVTVSPTARTP